MASREYANRMMKIERNEQLAAAIARCKANHPKVKRLAPNRVQVTNNKGTSYVVTLAQPIPEMKLAVCTCMAAINGKLCYHIAGALACPATDELLTSLIEPMKAQPKAQPAPELHHRRDGLYYGAFAI